MINALTAILGRLKLYKSTPENGLAIFCGDNLFDPDLGREKRVLVDLEPPRPITKSVYLCDNRFHTEQLMCTLQEANERRFGFIIVDGKGTLFGLVQGNNRQVLGKFSVDLPPKHGRGGQSSNRFANIRTEKRHNYLTKIAEQAIKTFITTNESSPTVNVDGLILAGSADLKHELANLSSFDERLGSKILKCVDITYGQEAGFYQAIQLAADSLQNVRLVEEIKLIESFFQHIAKDSGMYCFGVDETMRALEMSSVECLILWEELDLLRCVVLDTSTDTDDVESVWYVQPSQLKSRLEKQVSFKVKDQSLLLDWLVENYKNFGTRIQLVSDNSSEGNQFCKGFGGIGGILRFQLPSNPVDDVEYDDYDEYDY